MGESLSFRVSSRHFGDLAESDRSFFCGDRYLPLHPNHAAQIRLLFREDAIRLAEWAWSGLPPGWPDRTENRFKYQESLNVQGCWNDATERARVARWLFDRGIPLRRTIYLLYERERVVETTWRMVVRYWDAFAWSVGFEMVAVDHTLQWAACFHHEEVIVFGRQNGFRVTERAK